MKRELDSKVLGSLILLIFISSCNFTQKIKNGKMAYDRKQYYVAVDMLNDEFEANQLKGIKAELAYFLGKSYQKINNNRASINWYKEAYKLEYGPDALYDLAFALKQEELYDEAISIFRKLEQESGSNSTISREIGICQLASEWKAELKEKEYQISALNLNSGSGDYAATLFEDDYLVFTSDRKIEDEAEVYNWTGNAFSDIYISLKDGAQSRPFDRKINSKHNDGVACFNSFFNEMYFTRCYSPGAGDSYCKLMVSFRQGKVWTEPQTLDFFDDGVNYMQPALSENDSTLFFSCNHPEGAGGYDIFMSTRLTTGWTPPKQLPSPINTSGDENFPTVNGDTLFFSSNHHPGMGGLDVFMTFIRSDGTWQVPINLRAPINSGRDDFSYVIDNLKGSQSDILKHGYFSSSRKGMGNDDIFQFTQYRLVEDGPDGNPLESEETEDDITLYLAVKVVENRFVDPENPNSSIIGKDPIKGAGVDLNIGSTSESHNTGSLGFFVIEVEKGNDYIFKASKEGYLNNTNNFSTRDLKIEKGEKEVTYNLEIILDKIYKDKEINLENIYYDYNKWDIRQDAQPSLNQLSEILKENPAIRIQLASHTDCRGEDDFNQDLSQKRAQSAVEFIISTGIDPQRLSAKGFGESQLFIDCPCDTCSEEEHQQNRRTTFKIIDF